MVLFNMKIASLRAEFGCRVTVSRKKKLLKFLIKFNPSIKYSNII